jgi:hypothetical protein
VVTVRQPSAEEMESLLFAWRVAKHVKSNAIVYARDGQTIGVGAGQMSRVDAAKFGAMKAVLPLANSVAASDAFFPFPDGLEAVAAAGATAVIQPGGSVRDQEVVEAANRLGVAMALISGLGRLCIRQVTAIWKNGGTVHNPLMTRRKRNGLNLEMVEQAVLQLRWPDKNREVWFSLRENHEKACRFDLHQLRNYRRGASSTLVRQPK